MRKGLDMRRLLCRFAIAVVVAGMTAGGPAPAQYVGNGGRAVGGPQYRLPRAGDEGWPRRRDLPDLVVLRAQIVGSKVYAEFANRGVAESIQTVGRLRLVQVSPLGDMKVTRERRFAMVPGLKPGQSVVVPFTLSTNLTDGNGYFIVIVADFNNNQPELNESNNRLKLPINTRVADVGLEPGEG
jgi:hypothetical protein